jgi:hypothetical protein
VIFESPSKLVAIQKCAFFGCHFLRWLFVPPSVETIDGEAFEGSGIESIWIPANSVSFTVWDEFLVDFGDNSLVWVMGSPERIVIPASIEELRPFCCNAKRTLRTVEFESDSTLRSIGPISFASCGSLESIYIPSSVDVVGESCFSSCSSLRMVTFGVESKLRKIEKHAFGRCRSLESICIPSSVEVVCESCFCSCSSLRTVTFGAESKLRVIKPRAFDACPLLESVSVPASVEVIGHQRVISVSRS